MKKIIIIINCLLAIIMLSAKGQQAYTIHFSVPEAKENAKAYLLIDGHRRDTTLMSGGQAVFTGKISGHKLVTIFVDYLATGNFGHYYYCFLSPGTLNLSVKDIAGADRVQLSGNRLAEDYEYKLLEPVLKLNESAVNYAYQYQQSKAAGSADSLKYKNLQNESVYACFQVPQKFIRENAGSPVSIEALKMMGKGNPLGKVDSQTLKILFNSLTAEVKGSEEGVAYRVWLDKL